NNASCQNKYFYDFARENFKERNSSNSYRTLNYNHSGNIHTSFEELTPTLLWEFVEKIVIHESSARYWNNFTH
ncbi:MAG: DUF4368 domain-containing protein, partial [Lachnospiraceae bacterium]|nr:DUF4368 domain-containing protein [Lachnospiraceae bacterium]